MPNGPREQGSSSPRTFTVDQLRSAAGEELGVSDWFLVDQARIDDFAAVTEDHQWIHVDQVRASGGPYGATIAHGYLTLSLIPRLGSTIFAVTDARMGINYGLDKVRFPEAVTAGSPVRAVASLDRVDDVAAGVRAVVRYVVEIEGRSKPACVAETVRLIAF